MKVFAGIEGGASFSQVVLLDESGKVLSTFEGESTNHLLIGTEVCHQRIESMVRKAKELAKLDNNTILESLGLCLSGCEGAEGNERFKRELMERFPSLTKFCLVGADTLGSIITANPEGGIVLIAGTGSNSLLFNPNGTTTRCGGWGHILGDYGSAYWVSQRAIRAVIEAEENFSPIPYETEKTKRAILDHFNISDTFGLLEPIYVGFSKTQFSGLCLKLAKIAIEEKDELCRQIFSEAGSDLARHIAALWPSVDKSLIEGGAGGLVVVCVGSIFKSWQLLETAFFKRLNNTIPELTLVRLTKTSAIGAAFLAYKELTKKKWKQIPFDFKLNSKVLCHYRNGQILESNLVSDS